MGLATVRCDEPGCGWSKRVRLELVPTWHRVACPNCGKGEIVNDDDMAMCGLLTGMMESGLITTEGTPNLRVDTAPMRRGDGADVRAARARKEG